MLKTGSMKCGLAAGLAMIAAACTPDQKSVASTPDTTAVAATPAAELFDYENWEAYLGGGESSQYSSLDQINATNVAQLELAWTYETGDFAPRFNPVVVDGTMYVLSAPGTISALDAETGAEKWKAEHEGRIGDRGINYWESADGSEARLLYLNNGMLRALDARTGEKIASFGDGGMVDVRQGLDNPESAARPLMTSNPGRIYEDLVIISLHTGAYDYASSPADIHAYDVRTGELVWTFNVVPRVGQFGSDTWPEQDREKFGGVHNWSESTVDEELGIVFIPTGTARYDFYGGNREGDNLYGNSLVALDAKTGKRIWHFQAIHHDLWDLDFATAPKLMTITKDGERIPIVVQPSKQGFLYVFDRRDGTPIWPIEERPVPASDVPGEKASPTQPFPTWPLPFSRQSFNEADINPYISPEDQEKVREQLRTMRNEGLYTPPSLEGSISMPGHNGGANWGNVAADPTTQRVFVVSREIPVIIKLFPDNREAALEAMPNSDDPDVMPYRSPVDFMFQSNGLSAIGPPWSWITAYNMNTGNIIWRIPNGEIMTLAEDGITGTGSQAPRGGPVATAGGLLFVGTATDRKFRARDAANGKILWEFDTPAAQEGVPAVYEVNGRQYVTIPVGGVGHFAGGLGLPEPGQSQYMTFALPEGN